MSAFLYRLGRNSARHPFIVLGVWLVAAVAIVGLQAGAGRQVRQQPARPRRRVPARRRRPDGPLPQPGRPVRPHRAPHRRRAGSMTPPTQPTVDRARAAARRRARRRRRHGPVRAARRGRECRRQDGVPRRRVRGRQAHDHAARRTPTAVAHIARAGGVQVDLTGPLAAARAEGPEQRADRHRDRDHRAAARIRLGGRDGAPHRDRADRHLRRRRRGRRALGRA